MYFLLKYIPKKFGSFILFALLFFFNIQNAGAFEFLYKNVVWAEPNCDKPAGIVAWIEFKNSALIRYDYDELGLSKNSVKSVDSGSPGEAIFSEKIDSKSREFIFDYVKGNILEIYVMNSKSSTAVYRRIEGTEYTEGFAEMISCNPKSNAAVKIFQMINNPSIEKRAVTHEENYRNKQAALKKENDAFTEVTVIDLMVEKNKYKNNLVKLKCTLEFASGNSVACADPANERQVLYIDGETMDKKNLRWAINNCSHFGSDNSFSCRRVTVKGKYRPGETYELKNIQIEE